MHLENFSWGGGGGGGVEGLGGGLVSVGHLSLPGGGPSYIFDNFAI